MVTFLFYLKGKSQLWKYFLLNVVTTPVTGVFYALYLEKDYYGLQQRILKKGEYKLCPFCAELIPVAAEKCEHCERDV
jgi:hypothetical protein